MADGTIQIEIVEGRGSLVASRNGTTVATVNPGDGKVPVTYNTGDSFYFQAYPDTTHGYSFNKFCGDTACTITSTTNPFGGTISASGYLGVYFKGTPATIAVVVKSGVGGKVDVYRNTRYVSTVTSSQSINFFVNDTFSFIATPSTGYTFTEFCTDSTCSQSSTANPLTGTISSSGQVYAVFTSTGGGGGGGGRLCGGKACDTTKNFCISGNCIPQMYIYGAVGFLILMMMLKR